MILKAALNFLLSTWLLRTLGISLWLLSMFGIAKGLSGNLEEGELWWGYAGMGLVGLVFSAIPFIASVRD
jgi:hypothetical protein